MAPRLVIKRPLDDDASAFEVPHRAIDVFAHEIDLLARLPSFGWMDSQFAGREGEDQPAASCVYRVEAENILEKAPIRLGVAAEDDRVRAIDHVAADYLFVGRRSLSRQSDRPSPETMWSHTVAEKYDKLESMEVEPGENLLRMRLEPKPGEKLGTSQIAACLNYTTAAIALRSSN